MSRPWRSVPNQFSALGGWTGVPVVSGSWVATSGAKIAASATSATKARAILEPSGRARRRRPGRESRSVSWRRTSHRPDPRVDEHVEHVDHDVRSEERRVGKEWRAGGEPEQDRRSGEEE